MKNKSMTSAATGLAIGAVVGTAAYMMSDSKGSTMNVKKMKKTANKAMRNAGVLMESMNNMMR